MKHQAKTDQIKSIHGVGCKSGLVFFVVFKDQ